jgi:hypothetical protein
MEKRGRRQSMSVIYVARSAKLSQWASDVGLSKHVFKVGCTADPVKPFAAAAGWAGETDWTVVKSQPVPEDFDEAQAIERLARKERMIDPNVYPRLKGTAGVFKVLPAHVENSLLVARALAGAEELRAVKPKPMDFAAYLIQNALR